ncbi:hypothetical protein [Falsiroseomonas sp.]|uniref:hypothetical protein n=1 Tax=Falsiroseomonas sp. TaxID=2870721 RepID=UPI002734E674|nr:hypothetical protein [Falsiroseomonas sp.]MDP3417903.1 hypothetical protein [Falsiroseomonas sp.]
MTALATIAAARGAIAKARIDLSDEKEAQRQIGEALTSAGIEFRREVPLSRRDRPDFFLDAAGLAIEVKLRAGKMDIWRQLSRYAEHDRVLALMLVSNTSVALPSEIAGKPLYFISLGRAWL